MSTAKGSETAMGYRMPSRRMIALLAIIAKMTLVPATSDSVFRYLD
jgi:hypothetical protein